MSLDTLLNELNDDIDLLARSDEWLEEERKSISFTIDNLLRELSAILKAINIKRVLQDKNLVAIQELDENNGQLIIKIMKLRDGLNTLKSGMNKDELTQANYKAMLTGMLKDGYDLPIALQ